MPLKLLLGIRKMMGDMHHAVLQDIKGPLSVGAKPLSQLVPMIVTWP
jgi:hypothetical protein